MENEKPYKLGIALSGGGARGFAHAGALKAIAEAGLKPDIIAGVSAGAVIAVMYSAGLAPEQMLEAFQKSSFKDYTELRPGGGGIFNISKFQDFVIDSIAPAKHFEDLAIPTYVGVTNFDDGVPEAFSTGEIGPRVLASCSIPIIFKPVVINGKRYVDGGVLKNMPSWIIRDKCETLIGINVSPLHLENTKETLMEVAQRTYTLMSKANQLEDIERCDLAIQIAEISNYKVFNLKEIEKVFNAGYYNARRALRRAGLWQKN